MTQQQTSERLLTLDAMRGLAAMIVVVYHASQLFEVVPNAYLAVDFFFLLSGVVIGRAYAARLERGLSVRNFMKERVIRLYPLLILGLAVGYADALYQFAVQSPTRPSIKFLTIGMFFNMLMLPSPVSTYSIFPFNIPAWSLSFELWVNFVFAIWLVKLPSRMLVLLLGSMATGLVWIALQPAALNVGDAWENVAPGLLRTLVSFTAGLLMSRVLRHKPVPESMWSVLPMIALCVVLVAPTTKLQGIYDLLLVFIAFPLVVWTGAGANPPRLLRPAAQLLGDTSYAIYAVHYPLLFMAEALAERFHVPVTVWLPLFMVGILWLCHGVVKYYDAPLRRWLREKWLTDAQTGRVPASSTGRPAGV